MSKQLKQEAWAVVDKNGNIAIRRFIVPEGDEEMQIHRTKSRAYAKRRKSEGERPIRVLIIEVEG